MNPQDTALLLRALEQSETMWVALSKSMKQRGQSDLQEEYWQDAQAARRLAGRMREARGIKFKKGKSK